MKLILKAGTLLLLCASLFNEVDACTCLDYGVPTCALFSSADAVFVGKIERITSAMGDKDASVHLGGVGSISSRGGGPIWVHFTIEHAFKSVSGTTVKALTYSGTSCDLGVKEGQRWLIFAHRNDENSNLSFGACEGNGAIEKNSPLIAELEKLSKHSGPLSIRGRVAEQQFSSVKGAKAVITGNGLNLETVTDDDGSYSFQVPKSGPYTVKVIVPFSASLMRFRGDDRPIDEKPEETQTVFEYSATASPDVCDYQYLNTFKIDLKATASIAGVFLLDNWKYVPRFYPSVCRLMPTEEETLKECRTEFYGLNPDGTFKFEGLREGNYTIVLNDDDFLDGSSPFRRHYYPGVRDFPKAEPIVLGQGEEKTQIRFKAPPMIPLRAVSGQVFRKDGRPFSAPEGQKPYIKVHSYEQGKEPKFFFIHSYIVDWGKGKEGREVEMVDVSRDGKISLSLFEGNSYIVAVQTDPWGDKGECGMAKIDISSQPANPLRIVLDRKGRCDEKAFAKELGSMIER
jgi:hypothetical protein